MGISHPFPALGGAASSPVYLPIWFGAFDLGAYRAARVPCLEKNASFAPLSGRGFGAHVADFDDEADDRAGKEGEIPNFKGSYLGRFPLVSADFWTSDHLLERSRSVDAFSGTRARGTLTLKRR